MNILGGTTTEATISGLNSATNYSIEVAAVNSAGTGNYSHTIFAITSGTYSIIYTYNWISGKFGGTLIQQLMNKLPN